MLSYIKLLYKGYKFYKNNDIIKDKNYRDELKCIINDCGLYIIKAFQLAIPYIEIFEHIDKHTLNNIKNEFDMYYDMCNTHDLEHTKNLYKKDFKEDIYDKYSINEIIGSGSVAQVYKIKCKKTNKTYAMKVVHPIKYYHKYIIYFLYNLFSYFDLSVININIYKLIENIYTQFNLINEVNNTLMFKNLYETELIKAPNIIKFSKNIIIMDYIESNDISDDLKNTLITTIHNIQYFYDWFHGDLHKGNMIFSDNKLYVVDFSSSYNSNCSIDILRTIHYNVEPEFYLYALKTCDPNISKELLDEFTDIFNDTKIADNKCFEHHVICKKFVQFSKDKNITMDIRFVNIIFGVIHYDNIVYEPFDETIIKCYNLCKKYDSYSDYFAHVENDIKLNLNKKYEKYNNLKHLIKLD